MQSNDHKWIISLKTCAISIIDNQIYEPSSLRPYLVTMKSWFSGDSWLSFLEKIIYKLSLPRIRNPQFSKFSHITNDFLVYYHIIFTQLFPENPSFLMKTHKFFLTTKQP